jgi:hypothetical protein
MTIKVFISHKNTDTDLATRVANRVRFNDLEVYLDKVDDALLKDGPDLADHLLQTKDSWWVPWEIGVGSEKGFRMASYSEAFVRLPSYLEKWPDLHSDRDIDLYCEYSKKNERELGNLTQRILTEDSRMQLIKAESQKFHHKLKAALRTR